MQKVYSDVIQFRGSHYDFGYRQGELLRHSLLIKNRMKQWLDKNPRRFLIDVPHYKHIISKHALFIWDEMEVLAESLHMRMEDAVRQFGGYYLEYGRSGCSIFAQNNYFIRNYDNDPLSYEGRFVLYAPFDGGYATIGPSMQITGRTDGMNEHGLVMGYNFINRKHGDDGFMCNMIGRIILEQCATVDDAIQLLKEIPHRHSFSYVVKDAKQKETTIVEASPREVQVRIGNICTNHFTILTEENRYRMGDSIRRVKVLENEQHHAIDALEAYKLMNDTTTGIFSTNYGAWSGTLHTAIYYPDKLRIGFTIGGDRFPFIFHFKKWVHGEDVRVKRINGLLLAKDPFINMVEL